MVTQPRRIAALTLARRVAAEHRHVSTAPLVAPQIAPLAAVAPPSLSPTLALIATPAQPRATATSRRALGDVVGYAIGQEKVASDEPSLTASLTLTIPLILPQI